MRLPVRLAVPIVLALLPPAGLLALAHAQADAAGDSSADARALRDVAILLIFGASALAFTWVAADRIERREERLQEQLRLQARVLSVAAHELNTPLTALRLSSYVLTARPEGLDARQRRALDVVSRNILRMSGLVRDTLDMARLHEGRLKIAKAPVAFERLLLDAAETFAEAARAGRVEIAVLASSELQLEADADRMAQVLANLVGNAVKFTPSGGRVTIHADERAGEVLLRIADTGAGLTPEQVARLFQPFARAHEAAGAPAGNGLGLYIAKGIVEAHGGRIGCESEGPGRGATFWVALPAPTAPAQPREAAPAQEIAVAGAGRRP